MSNKCPSLSLSLSLSLSHSLSHILKLDPRVEQDILISTGNDSSVPVRELGNVCGATASMDLKLAIHAVDTTELSQVMTNKIVKTGPNDNVNNILMNECGTTASVDLGLAIHAVGTIELSQVMTNKTVKTEIGECVSAGEIKVGVGTGNMFDNGLGMTGMCQKIMSVHIDNKEAETTVTRPAEAWHC